MNQVTYSSKSLPKWWYFRPWFHTRVLHASLIATVEEVFALSDDLEKARYEIRDLKRRLEVTRSQLREYRDARDEDKK